MVRVHFDPVGATPPTRIGTANVPSLYRHNNGRAAPKNPVPTADIDSANLIHDARFVSIHRYSHGGIQTRAVRKRSALPITDTDERLIASAAISGLKSHPVIGYNTPAASGTPSAL